MYKELEKTDRFMWTHSPEVTYNIESEFSQTRVPICISLPTNNKMSQLSLLVLLVTLSCCCCCSFYRERNESWRIIRDLVLHVL